MSRDGREAFLRVTRDPGLELYAIAHRVDSLYQTAAARLSCISPKTAQNSTKSCLPSAFSKPQPKTARFPFEPYPRKKKGDSARRRPPESSVQATSTCAARSQSRSLIRTSSRREVIRRVWLSLPFAAQRASPPRSRFSWTRFSVLQRLSGCSSTRRQHRRLAAGLERVSEPPRRANGSLD
jgi:hypothetical protein